MVKKTITGHMNRPSVNASPGHRYARHARRRQTSVPTTASASRQRPRIRKPVPNSQCTCSAGGCIRLLQVLENANLRLEDVRMIIPHQANARIIEAAAKRLGVNGDVMVNNIANYGNTSTASIPLALKEAVGAQRLKRGDHVVLVGFGAGLTWGACVLQWEGAPVRVAA